MDQSDRDFREQVLDETIIDTENSWRALESSLSIAFAGAIAGAVAYCWFLILVVFAYQVSTGFAHLVPSDFLQGLLSALFLGSGIAFLVGCLSALVSVCIVGLLNHSLGYPASPREAGLCVGSLTGYLPTAWLLFAFKHANNSQVLLTLVLGPVFAMAICATGSAWQLRKHSQNCQDQPHDQRYSRLSIRHLIAITTWVAAIFAFANLVGTHNFAIAAFTWLLVHVMMIIAIRFFRAK